MTTHINNFDIELELNSNATLTTGDKQLLENLLEEIPDDVTVQQRDGQQSAEPSAGTDVIWLRVGSDGVYRLGFESHEKSDRTEEALRTMAFRAIGRSDHVIGTRDIFTKKSIKTETGGTPIGSNASEEGDECEREVLKQPISNAEAVVIEQQRERHFAPRFEITINLNDDGVLCEYQRLDKDENGEIATEDARWFFEGAETLDSEEGDVARWHREIASDIKRKSLGEATFRVDSKNGKYRLVELLDA